MTVTYVDYIKTLRRGFHEYRRIHFGDKLELFEDHGEGGPVVWTVPSRDDNVVTPTCAPSLRETVIEKIPRSKRHRHFGSMQSSQALVQSAFGVIDVFDRLGVLAHIRDEEGGDAFGPSPATASLTLEKQITTLGEGPKRATSIDVWLEGRTYRVAVECKLAEASFGTCSRPRLEDGDPKYCNGNFEYQGERLAERCSLTEAGVRYWDFAVSAFGWSPVIDHSPCPMRSPYQLIRNVLAACVSPEGNFESDRGHALVIYDARNPSTFRDGACGMQWAEARSALRLPHLLRRLSWQSFLRQLPDDDICNWLAQALRDKYGLVA
ncbi:PGN_0703 family putative restriction endonuclease [Bradyrhizobium sp. BR 1433]|uniref:PGN_0703 family putative restriction endonuclease n=1 Tax=Bradyrhizobium sp. BR 1433 TaxID=3447967 RepID=UPI003EE4CA21